MKRATGSWIAGALLAAVASAQPLRGHLALTQAVRDAASDRLVAIVATHPDDQWTVPAAYLRFRKGYRVAVLLGKDGFGDLTVGGLTGGPLEVAADPPAARVGPGPGLVDDEADPVPHVAVVDAIEGEILQPSLVDDGGQEFGGSEGGGTVVDARQMGQAEGDGMVGTALGRGMGGSVRRVEGTSSGRATRERRSSDVIVEYSSKQARLR